MSILQMDKLRLGAQKMLRKNLVIKGGLRKAESSARSLDPGVGGFFCAPSPPLGWAGIPSPTTKAAGPGLLHLGPWKSPKQEPGEELLVIRSRSHLVCLPAEP